MLMARTGLSAVSKTIFFFTICSALLLFYVVYYHLQSTTPCEYFSDTIPFHPLSPLDIYSIADISVWPWIRALHVEYGDAKTV